MSRLVILSMALFTIVGSGITQSRTDSTKIRKLDEVTVTGRKPDTEQLPKIKETFLFSGKKRK